MIYDVRSLLSLLDKLRGESLEHGIPAIDPDDGMVLASYAHAVSSNGGRIFVDAGAGIGYSTLWIMMGLRWCRKCRIIAIEYYNDRAAMIEKNLAGIAGEYGISLEIINGDALDIVRGIDKIDYAFIDVEKSQYDEMLTILESKLPSGGVALFHNAYFPPPPQSFFDRLAKSPAWQAIIHPTSAGLLAAVKTA